MIVTASNINEYFFCPRCVYLKAILKIPPEQTQKQQRGRIGHLVRRGLFMRQDKIIEDSYKTKSIQESTEAELEKIISEIPILYKNQIKNIEDYNLFIQELKPAILSEARILSQKLSQIVSKLGKDAVGYVKPQKTNYFITSKKLALSGRIDKIVNNAPVMINTDKVSEKTDIGDKLQACAYAMLLEEETQRRVPYSFIEYTRTAEQRPIMITERLKKQLLEVIDKILKMRYEVPRICPHGRGNRCAECGFENKCYEV